MMENKLEYIIVDNKKIKIVLNPKKNVKRITFRVRDNQLHISCPLILSENKILEALEQDKIKKFVRENIVTDDNLLNQVHLFGEAYELSLLEDKREYVKIIGKLMIIHYKRDITKPLYAFYEEELEKYLLSIYDQALKEFKLTKNPPELKFRNFKARHAEYSRTKHEIVFNIAIAKYEKEFIKAVLYHELTHVYHFDHSDKFYCFLEKKYPGYQEYMKKQKKLKYADKY